ncbi:GntR family transcriptional regulator [Arthrobacter sp. MW3 TE3886]|uniref:GntR family transcriptional regulator n=1 Tax=Arthrobacter sp. MW3 TE3886 TaxID=3156254 RepID=UPI003514183F
MTVLESLSRGNVTPAAGWRKQDWAYEQIREWILAGELKPSQRVDQEQLAAVLGISRIPLREGLARLISEGWVSGQPHRRLIVSELSLSDAKDVYGGRQAVEAMLAEAAARNAKPSSLAKVRDVLDRQREVLTQGAANDIQRLDRAFHTGIYELAGMPKTLAVATNLYSMSERYVRLYLGDQERIDVSFHEHEAIYHAVEKGDTYAARKLTEQHIDRGLEVLECRLLRPQPEGPLPALAVNG